jgi:RND family efflux transporter MFP subunit
MKNDGKISTGSQPRAFAALALALAVALSTAGCERTQAQEAEVAAAALPEVLTAQARAADAAFELRLPARAIASESARLYPRATGFIAERHVDLGDRVKKGQVLALITAPEIDQAVREAEAGLGQAQADLALAKVNFERAARLVLSGAISKEEHNDRDAAQAVAQAALAAAQARLQSARERQSFREVRAPFDGVIAARNVERGDRVVGDSSGAALPMFEVSVLDPLRVLIDVPQSAALQVRPGLAAQVSFPELPGAPLQAQVIRSAMRISDEAGGMRVELQLPNPDDRLPAGMQGEVRLQVPRTATAVIVPISAVVQGPSESRVALLDANSAIDLRTVRIGRNLGNEVELLDGIQPGDTVILSPNALLQHGTRVRRREVEAS